MVFISPLLVSLALGTGTQSRGSASSAQERAAEVLREALSFKRSSAYCLTVSSME